MSIKTSTGAMVAGTLSRDPEIKETRTGNQFLSMSVKAHSVKDDSGKWNSVFVECCIWRDLDRWDGLLHKGDFVVAFGRELKSHESNGKTYWNLDAEGVLVGGLVNASWVQMAIDMIQPTEQAGTDDFAPVEDETPFDPGAEPPQSVSQPEPAKQPAPAVTPEYDDDSRPISDTGDLPF